MEQNARLLYTIGLRWCVFVCLPHLRHLYVVYIHSFDREMTALRRGVRNSEIILETQPLTLLF